MIINALTIENFKGIREPVRVEFKPITLLFGPNSAGKSTVIQALHYAREILDRNNVDVDQVSSADDSFDLGGFTNIVHKHDLNLPIRLKFEFSLSPLADYTDFLTGKVDNAWIEYEIKWSNFLEAPLVTSSTVGLDGEYFGKIICAEDAKRVRISEINFNHHLLVHTSFEIKEGEEQDLALLLLIILGSVKAEFWTADSAGKTLGLFVAQTSALPRFANLNDEIRSEKTDEEEDSYYSDEPSNWEKLNDFLRT